MAECVCVYATDGTCLYLNAATERVFGRPRAEVLGRVLWDVFPHAAGNPFHARFLEVARTGAAAELEHRSSIDGRLYVHRLFPAGGRIVTFGRDVTEERRAGEALQLHTRLLERMAEGVSLSDERGLILYTNPAEDRMFGYGPGELVGRHVSEQNAYSPEENARRVGEVIAELRARGEWEGEFDNRRKDGSRFTTRARITALELGGRMHFVCVQEDVTERRREAEHARRLALLTDALSGSLTAAQVGQAVVEVAHEAVGALLSGLYVAAGAGAPLRLVGARGLAEAALAPWREVPQGADSPLWDALRTGEPVWLGDAEACARAYPAHLPLLEREGVTALVKLPLLSEGRALGALSFAFGRPRPFDPALRRFLSAVAAQCAHALERARLYEAERAARAEAEAVAARARQLLDVTERLGRALTPEGVADEALTEATDSLGARSAAVWLLASQDADAPLALLRARHFPPAAEEAYRAIPRDSPLPVAGVVRTGEPVLLSDWRTYAERYPESQPRAREFARAMDGGIACLPLQVEGRTIGGLVLNFRAARTFDAAERWFLQLLAHHLAQALERARRHARARQQGAESAFLARASEALASSLDPAGTLESLVQLAVPALADGCGVYLLGPDGAVLRHAVAHADPALAEAMRAFHVKYPVRLDARGGIGRVLRTGEPELVPLLPEAALEALPEGLREDTRRLGVRSYLSVPMESRGRRLGALTLAQVGSGRSFGPADLPLVLDLARRAALAVDNAQLYLEAQSAVRTREDFLQVASHELKTPLTPLALKLQTLARELGAQPETDFTRRARAHVEAGRKQVRKLSELIGDLLDVSRIMGGRFALELEEVELAGLVREVASRHESQAEQAGCAVSLSLGEVRGRWDRLRLEQVVTNLLDNALKYGAGKPVQVRLARQEGRAVLEVQDAGIGLEPSQAARIFERFERAVSERHYGGLGLGLYITRTIVEGLGGHVGVTGAPGEGACFRVELPLAAPAEQR
jgi:PAS domain S-box-containing protein